MRTLLLLLALTLCACAGEDNREPMAPQLMRVGVVPDQSEASLSMRYGKLLDYLEAETGIDFELSLPSSYEDLLREFNAGRLDMAKFGGSAFIQAERSVGAMPLVMRDIDLEFMSCYLVRTSDVRQSVAEFKNERFSFGPRLSTSGHAMPRHFLSLSGIVPEQFFSSLRYSSSHQQTAHWVADGSVTIGVANCYAFRSMLADGQISAETVRVLDTTPPYSNYVWVTQQSVAAAVRNRLREAFLALDMTDTSHRGLLEAMGAHGYLPAGKGDFDDIRAAARAVGPLDPVDSN